MESYNILLSTVLSKQSKCDTCIIYLNLVFLVFERVMQVEGKFPNELKFTKLKRHAYIVFLNLVHLNEYRCYIYEFLVYMLSTKLPEIAKKNKYIP